MSTYALRRLFSSGKLKKVAIERLSEPLHLNLASVAVALFGSFRAKVAFDLVVRPQYAWPILHAADTAREYGIKHITIAEFGVASGAGLLNMCEIARRVTASTGVVIDVVGFDSGQGMPPAIDFRDHPEAFQAGDFPMEFEKLRAALPSNARLIIGAIEQTIPDFVRQMTADRPLGFIAVDVDYYSSAVACLKVLTSSPDHYLPWLPVYLDDVTLKTTSRFCGELLAVDEFNDAHIMRKIAPFPVLRARRLFKNPIWIDQMFAAQIHDHPVRSANAKRLTARVIANEYVN